MYADKITDSMRRAIDETDRRRIKQIAYNTEHNITPRQITKSMGQLLVSNSSGKTVKAYVESDDMSVAADPVVQYMSSEQLDKHINRTKKAMEKAAKELDFIEAARLRDEMYALQEKQKSMSQKSK
jgi:excinuclease ABC subunit B